MGLEKFLEFTFTKNIEEWELEGDLWIRPWINSELVIVIKHEFGFLLITRELLSSIAKWVLCRKDI